MLCSIKFHKHEEIYLKVGYKTGLRMRIIAFSIKLRSEIVWHRFFAVPALICHFRSYIAVRKLFLKTSPNFSSRFCACARFWQSPDILGKIKNLRISQTKTI